MGLNTGQTVFSQIMDFLPKHEHRRFVKQYRGHYKVKTFSCMDQYLCMAFIHFRYQNSLEIESLETAEALYRIIRECVFNALKHAKPECITVSCERHENNFVCTISDDGIGLPGDFNPKSSSGTGTRIVQYYADRIGATIDWRSRQDVGCCVIIKS